MAPAGAPPTLCAQLLPGLQPQTWLNLPQKSLAAGLVSWLAACTRGSSAGTNPSRSAAARSRRALRCKLRGWEGKKAPKEAPPADTNPCGSWRKHED